MTEAVRRRPYAVVLLDEIEKAHPDVFNILLQVLDDGRLTDGQGRTVDFTNTVIIMTSNVGSELLAGDLGDEAADEALESALRRQFRPEFLNRIDDIVRFDRLSDEHLREIVDIQIERLEGVLAGRGLAIELTDAARRFLAREGYDPAYGARPLKRAIQNHLQNPLAMALLEGTVDEGDMIRVDIDEHESRLVFESVAAKDGSGATVPA